MVIDIRVCPLWWWPFRWSHCCGTGQGHFMMETYHPLGLVGVISAFNFPNAVFGWNVSISMVRCPSDILFLRSLKPRYTVLYILFYPPIVIPIDLWKLHCVEGSTDNFVGDCCHHCHCGACPWAQRSSRSNCLDGVCCFTQRSQPGLTVAFSVMRLGYRWRQYWPTHQRGQAYYFGLVHGVRGDNEFKHLYSCCTCSAPTIISRMYCRELVGPSGYHTVKVLRGWSQGCCYSECTVWKISAGARRK